VGVSARAVGPGITWYDVLGALPTATTGEIRRGYDAKAGLIRPELLSGAASTVVSAASRAKEILDTAWQVLGDAESRAGYDEVLGIWRAGEGLAPPANIPSQPGTELSAVAFLGLAAFRDVAVFLGGLQALSDLMAPRPPTPPRRVRVPEVRGLFYGVCFEAVGRLGLRVTAVRLTEHPMPVEGLIVSQSPAAGESARRDSQLTVQVWHPPKNRP
jgi:PASTA domain